MANVHRITGCHPLIDGPGVGAWFNVDTPLGPLFAKLQEGRQRLGWHKTPFVLHDHGQGYGLAFRAPIDQLYTACTLVEWALGMGPTWNNVCSEGVSEQNPKWLALRAWARQLGLRVFDDEDGLTIGAGKYGRTWPLDQLPSPADLGNWRPEAIPAVCITGTNGKTTTSRLLGAIASAAGHCVGMTSSDGVLVAGNYEAKGDWTGPGAARMVLRHSSVDFAVLETARGGIMRRGLVIDDYQAAAVTNVSADHLGAWGIHTASDMAAVKMSVAKGLRSGGALIRNADCELSMRAPLPDRPMRLQTISSKSFDSDLFVKNDSIWFNGESESLVHLGDIPLSMGGAAMHNVENAMIAAALARTVGIGMDAIRAGLKSVQADDKHSRGRSNLILRGGKRFFVDFAHNEDGLRRVVEMALNIQAKRRFLVFGQAGDRSESLLRGLSRAAAQLKADHYFIKALPNHSYGADPNAVANLLALELRQQGIDNDAISIYSDEMTAAKAAVERTADGDLLLLLSHEDFDSLLDLAKNSTQH